MATLSGLRPTARRLGRHWLIGYCRRHVPFALYTAATLSVMGWVAWTMIRIG